MQSGIGPADDLGKHGIPVMQDLPAAGRKFQEHIPLGGRMWEYVNSDPAVATP